MTASSPIHIAYLGDSPRVTSGFGTCNRMAIQALIDAGYRVSAQTWLDATWRKDDPWDLYAVSPDDPLGEKYMMHFLQSVQPDLIIVHADPGTAFERVHRLNIFAGSIPVVCWFPVEGVPLHDNYVKLATHLKHTLTYSAFGADAVEAAGGNRPAVQTLGWNHANFRVFPGEVRDHLRACVGLLPEHFLSINVAVNKRGNRQPAILRAAKLAQTCNRPYLYYMHCAQQGNQGLQGWDLESKRRYYGAEHALMKEDQRDQYRGVRYDDETTDEAYLAIPIPQTGAEKAALFQSLSLIAKYNLADVYIDPSSVQGFNLPTVEAAACGLPVVTVNDGAARTCLFSELATLMYTPDMIDDWHTGAELKLVGEQQIHAVTRRLDLQRAIGKDGWQRLRAKSRAYVEEHYTWDMTPLLDTVARAVAELGTTQENARQMQSMLVKA